MFCRYTVAFKEKCTYIQALEMIPSPIFREQGDEYGCRNSKNWETLLSWNTSVTSFS